MSPRPPSSAREPEGQTVFRALADPTRRRLLDELRRGPRTTGELVATQPEMTRFGVMAHLNVLEQAGLVLVTRRGRHRINHLNPVPIAEIYQRWMHPFAEESATTLLSLRRRTERFAGVAQASRRAGPRHGRVIIVGS